MGKGGLSENYRESGPTETRHDSLERTNFSKTFGYKHRLLFKNVVLEH